MLITLSDLSIYKITYLPKQALIIYWVISFFFVTAVLFSKRTRRNVSLAVALAVTSCTETFYGLLSTRIPLSMQHSSLLGPVVGSRPQ